MERQIISKRIGEIQDDISRLRNALYAMESSDIQRYPDNYEVLSTDAALRAEKITCRLRHLIYSSTNIKKPEYLASAATTLGISINQVDGIVEISLPGLLPKRKRKSSSEFLFDSLYFSLDQYCDTHEILKYSQCVVCFSHIYNRELPTRRIRDYDNLELKQILDILSSFIMIDDNGLLCDAYNTTELGEYDCTLVSVMDKDIFREWLEKRKDCLESIVDF